MAPTINDFKSKFTGGGVRNTMFRVTMIFPQAVVASVSDLAQDSEFLVKASAIPGSTNAKIPIYFRGRQLKVNGDKEFDDWALTVYSDRNYKMRSAFEKWAEIVGRHSEIYGEIEYENYFSRAYVTQLDRNHEPIRSYMMEGVWPISVDSIAVAFDSVNQIQEFGVTLAVQYWAAADGDIGNVNSNGFSSDPRRVSS